MKILRPFVFILIAFIGMGNQLVQAQNKIDIYTMPGCGRCEFSVKYAKEHKLNFVEYSTARSSNNQKMWQLVQSSPAYMGGSISMPVIVKDGKTHLNIEDLESFMSKLGTSQSASTGAPATGCIAGDCENGHGTYIYKNKDRYEGGFVNKLRSGNGRYVWANGAVYDGEWKNGKQDGNGTYTNKAGTVQTGIWVQNKLQKNTSATKSNNDQSTNSSNLSSSQINEMLERHNYYRREAGAPDLVWSNELAKHAQEWALHLKSEGCKLEHRPSSGSWSDNYGENLAMNHSKSPSYAVDQWAGEKKDYDKAAISQANMAAWHYTQLIWAKTTQLGCAIVACGSGANIVVCNYSPAGNVLGQSPYKKK